METSPRALLVADSTQGHWTPCLYFIRHLVAHNVNITICTSRDRADEMKQYKANGDFGNVDVEVVVVFSHTKTTRLTPQLTLITANELELKMKELKPDRFSCIIADMFMSYCQEIADEWGIPHYSLFPTACSYSLVLFHGTRLVDERWYLDNPEKKDECTDVPGLENFTARDLFLPESIEELLILHSRRMRRSAGLLINTFEELDQKSLDVLRCQLESDAIGTVVPKVFSVGPLMLVPTLPSVENQGPAASEEYIKWLDRRPKSSVLFICFGSQDELPLPNVKAVAKALESLEVYFLWGLRLPQETGNEDPFLPEFEARTRDRGLVVKGWIRQLEVLLHPSTGGFLSHCGWNSCQESIRAGVPIVAHPMWADQYLNAKVLITTAGAAVGIKHTTHWDSDQYAWEEVAEAIQTLMVKDEGDHIRLNMVELQQAALRATAEGGSSQRSFQEFVNEINRPRQIPT